MAFFRMPQRTSERLIAAAGLGILIAALSATQFWLDRHFLPSFLMSRQSYVRIEMSIRMAVAASGIALILGARFVATRLTTRTLAIVVAIVLALAASEVVLRNIRL